MTVFGRDALVAALGTLAAIVAFGGRAAAVLQADRAPSVDGCAEAQALAHLAAVAVSIGEGLAEAEAIGAAAASLVADFRCQAFLVRGREAAVRCGAAAAVGLAGDVVGAVVVPVDREHTAVVP